MIFVNQLVFGWYDVLGSVVAAMRMNWHITITVRVNGPVLSNLHGAIAVVNDAAISAQKH